MTPTQTPPSAGLAVDDLAKKLHTGYPLTWHESEEIAALIIEEAQRGRAVEEVAIPDLLERGGRGETLTTQEQSAWTGYELGWRDGRTVLEAERSSSKLPIDMVFPGIRFKAGTQLSTLYEAARRWKIKADESYEAEAQLRTITEQRDKAVARLKETNVSFEKLLREWMYTQSPIEAQILGKMSPPAGPFADAASAIVEARSILASIDGDDHA